MDNPNGPLQDRKRLYTASRGFFHSGRDPRARGTNAGSLSNPGIKALTCSGVRTHSGGEAVRSLP
jgi:hypothetical protein